MDKGPIQINATSVDEAWMNTLGQLLVPGVDRLVRLTVHISMLESSDLISHTVQNRIDLELVRKGLFRTGTTSNTIFPNSMWNPDLSREQLYSRYMSAVPILKRWDRANCYGTYFERLISYPYGKEQSVSINQLEEVINIYTRGIRRRSALQAAIYNPHIDLTAQTRRGFPCMQYVTFDPSHNSLAVTATYTTQYIFDRAYGNYLGLYRLGRFMANEMSLDLREINIISMGAELGRIKKTDSRALLTELESLESPK